MQFMGVEKLWDQGKFLDIFNENLVSDDMKKSKYIEIRFKQTVKLIQNRLQNHQPMQISKSQITDAAVLILLLNKNDIPYLLFTKRTELVETHKGQISFPGGVKDKGDKTLIDTAVRETYEEVGIPPEKINYLGQLDDFFTVTNFIISPFAGYVENAVNYNVNESEVAEILEVPLSLFLSNKFFEVKKWEYHGQKYDVYFYYYGEHVIWGATAFILNRFIDTVFQYNPAPKPVLEDPRNHSYLQENKFRKGTKS